MYYSLAIEVRTDAEGVCKTNMKSKGKYGCSLKGDRAIPVAIWVAAFPPVGMGLNSEFTDPTDQNILDFN
eukprot:12121578-Prorocentrum_lima.AAC.1